MKHEFRWNFGDTIQSDELIGRLGNSYHVTENQPGTAPSVILADKGYDTDAILAELDAECIAAVIPPKRNRKIQRIIDGHIYALRNLVERCSSKLKHNRWLATRYDKTATSFLGFVIISAIGLWLRHFDDRT